jgi:phosphoglycerol transferase MdoB-like AlkP superfamily enzyme
VEPNLNSQELRSFSRLIFFFLATFGMARLGFYLLYVNPFDVSQLFWVLWKGLRFDFAAVAYMVFLPLLLSRFFVFSIFQKRVFKDLFLICISTLWFVLLSLSLTDILYYPHSGKKIGYEAFIYLDSSLLKIAVGAFQARPLDFFVAAPFIFALAFGVFKLTKAWLSTISADTQSAFSQKILSSSALILLLIFVIFGVSFRGGFQRVPLRLGDSFLTDNANVNNAILNATYSVLRSTGQSEKIRFMEPEAAFQTVYSSLGINPDQDLLQKAEYPIYQVQKRSGLFPEQKNLNIVLILLESWTSKHLFMGSEEGLNVTPQFNRLAQQGAFWPRFFASGFRTTSGIYSSFTGQPDQLGIPVMRRKELANNFGSFSTLLKPRGYTNFFISGTPVDFDNTVNMLRFQQFDYILGDTDFDPKSTPMNVWGIDDGPMLDRLLLEMSKLSSPFIAFSLTATSHSPYEVPPGFPKLIDEKSRPDGKYINTLHYADAMLGRFMEEASKQPWFEDTVFVFTGDHTHHINLDPYQNQKVPLLIYSPKYIKPQIRKTIASHTDILPTIGDMVGLETHSSFGKNLWLLGDTEGESYFMSGTEVGIATHTHFLVRPPKNESVIVFEHSDQVRQIADAKYADFKELAQKALAYYQASHDLLNQNRIHPTKK